MQEDRFQERYKVNEEYSSLYDETDDEPEEETYIKREAPLLKF